MVRHAKSWQSHGKIGECEQSTILGSGNSKYCFQFRGRRGRNSKFCKIIEGNHWDVREISKPPLLRTLYSQLLPHFSLASSHLSPFWLQNIMHCCIIVHITSTTHPVQTPISNLRLSHLPYPYRPLFSQAPSPLLTPTGYANFSKLTSWHSNLQA